MADGGELAGVARTIFAEALAECGVERALERKLVRGAGPAFSLRDGSGPEVVVDLAGVRRVIVVAVGKAAAPMLGGLLRRLPLPDGCEVDGVLIAPQRPEDLPERVRYFAGGHPLPNGKSFAGASAVLALLERAGGGVEARRTFCLFLISGGASAMMELPLDRALSLEDTVTFHRALVHSGATIAEINCVRKHFSAVKGGRLGRMVAAMPNVTMLVSDVRSGDMDALGSGPTLPDRSTVAECREVLERYGLMREFPAAVRRFFAGEVSETPKPGEFAARAFTLLSSNDLAEAARRRAEALGFTAVIDNRCEEWECRAAAEYLVARLRELRRQHGRVCLISAGEVTVQVPGEFAATGVGGRNQHFALIAATLLGAGDREITVLSAGSDGIDGNSRFAGAVVDRDSMRMAGEESVREALLRFDSATALSRIGATIETGPTGNNLRDLRLLLCG